jgi:hypothetical protein
MKKEQKKKERQKDRKTSEIKKDFRRTERGKEKKVTREQEVRVNELREIKRSVRMKVRVS